MTSSVYHHCDACGGAITTADAPVECAGCRPPDMLADVGDFHERFGQSYDGPPRALPDEIREFRVAFLEEEPREYRLSADALVLAMSIPPTNHDVVTGLLADQLDALVDTVYVALGNVHLQGFGPRFAEAWRRVHAANMAKRRASADGADSLRGNAADVVKPPGWTAPDHTDLVADHAHRVTP